MKKSAEARLLTDAELELMNILWKHGEGSVTEVMSHLPPERELAYTSVSTILRILEQKGVVEAQKVGRGHVYSPRVTKEDYEVRALDHVVDNVFGGIPMALARQLLQSSELGQEDLAELKALIQRLEK